MSNSIPTIGEPVLSAPAPAESAPLDNAETEDNDVDSRLTRIEDAILSLLHPKDSTPESSPNNAPVVVPVETVDTSVTIATPVNAPVIPEQHPSEALPPPFEPVTEGEQHPSEAASQQVDFGGNVSGSGIITPFTDDEQAEIDAQKQDTTDDDAKDARIAELERQLANK